MRNRLLLIGVVAALALAAFATGAYEHLSPERLRGLIRDAGAFGPLLIVALFVVLQPLGVPGAIFLLVIVSLWPFEVALALNYAGAVGAGMAGFALARYLGRDAVSSRMPGRLREWDERLSDRGIPVVVSFRAMFFLNPASHWALGLSRVPTATAAVGTAIGFAPWVLLWTWFGAEIIDWLASQTLGIVVVVALALAGYWAVRRHRRSRQPLLEPLERDEGGGPAS